MSRESFTRQKEPGVQVAPEQPFLELPEDMPPLNYRLGEQISLVGYRLSGPIQSGAPLTVTLYWRADEPPAGNYTVFVHLLGEDEAGQPLAQHDGPPRHGRG